ncbi:MAG: hypothetical protein Q7P63_04030 [Verrucomicrobiota bacterium JB022]|nr:hypothetical protein [Verrucomicrobiota bacterium JB022]
MKTMTLQMPDPVYEDIMVLSRDTGRSPGELVSEAMAAYRARMVQKPASLKNRRPTSVGGPIAPAYQDRDLLDEMRHDPRD